VALRVRRAQEELRRRIDDEAWLVFLQLEDEVNARAAAQVRIVFERALAVYAYATLDVIPARRRTNAGAASRNRSPGRAPV
jgi:hypothetical protein